MNLQKEQFTPEGIKVRAFIKCSFFKQTAFNPPFAFAISKAILNTWFYRDFHSQNRHKQQVSSTQKQYALITEFYSCFIGSVEKTDNTSVLDFLHRPRKGNRCHQSLSLMCSSHISQFARIYQYWLLHLFLARYLFQKGDQIFNFQLMRV